MAEEQLPGGTFVGRYRIESALGAGGMGVVYVAEDTMLHRRVALKVLPSDQLTNEMARQRLLREARAAAALDHPNLCTVFDAGEDRGHVFVAMQLLEGQTLARAIHDGRLEPLRGIGIARDVAAALDAAHARGVVHRDLKPGNVMLTRRGAIVLDFGLAHLAAATDQAITREGEITGTVPYMAPEQIRGDAPKPPVDLFALGVMIFEMISLRRPFDRETPVATISAILYDPPPPFPTGRASIPALENLVLAMLAKVPTQRPSARDVAARLEAIATENEALEDIPTTALVLHNANSEPEPVSKSSSDSKHWVSDASLVSKVIAPEARKMYVKGRRLWEKRTPPMVQEALACFQAAIDLEPHFPEAYAGMASAYTHLAFLDFVSPRMMLARARAAANRALELKPDDGEVLATLGFVKVLFEWDWSGARAAFERAIEVDPSNALAHHWFGLLLAMRLEIDEARTHLLRAFELDPLSPAIVLSPQFAEFYAGNFMGAARICRDVVDSEPSFPAAHYYLGRALEAEGQIEAATLAYRASNDLVPVEMEALPSLAACLFKLGRTEEAEEIAARIASAASHRYISPFFHAIIASGRRDSRTTLAALRGAVVERATRVIELHADPRFSWLHDDAEFRELVREVGFGTIRTIG